MLHQVNGVVHDDRHKRVSPGGPDRVQAWLDKNGLKGGRVVAWRAR